MQHTHQARKPQINSSEARNDESLDKALILQELLDEAVDNRLRTTHIEQDIDVCRIRKRINGRLTECRIESDNLVAKLIAELRSKPDAHHDVASDCYKITVTHHNVLCHIECYCYQTTTGPALTIQINHPRNIPDTLEQTTLSTASINKLRNHTKQHTNGVTVVSSPFRELLCDIYYALLGERQNLDTKLLSFESSIRKHIPRVNQVTATHRGVIHHYDADHVFVDWQRSAEPALMNTLLASYPSATIFVVAKDATNATRQLTDVAVSERQLATNLMNFIELDHARLICPHCAEAHHPQGPEITLLEQHNIKENYTLNYAPGCMRCENTGVGEHQTLMSLCDVNDRLRQSIETRCTEKVDQRLQIILQGESLKEQRRALVCSGLMPLQSLH